MDRNTLLNLQDYYIRSSLYDKYSDTPVYISFYQSQNQPVNNRNIFWPNVFSNILAVVIFPFSLCWFPTKVKENESVIIEYWGDVFSEINQPGVYFINPFGVKKYRVLI